MTYPNPTQWRKLASHWKRWFPDSYPWRPHDAMGKQKKTRKYAVAKKMISAKDARLPSNREKEKKKLEKKEEEEKPVHVDQTPSALWFKYNTALGPPYHVLVDTNFINFSIKNKVSSFVERRSNSSIVPY